MSSKTRSLQRGISHTIMKKAGIQSPNKRRSYRNRLTKRPHKTVNRVSRRSFFSQNWRDILNDKKSRRLLRRQG